MMGLPSLPLAPTERSTTFREGTARLLRFRSDTPANAPVVLLVPSLINRWYVLDLRPGASLVAALVQGGFDVWCLDWGVPNDEDRYLSWDQVIAKVRRAVRRVRRATGAAKIGLIGYCMGATVASIHTALHPEDIGAFVNLAGPIDFEHAGELGHMVDPRWFDPAAITSAGNLQALQMQAGFVALRPTANLAKLVGFIDRAQDDAAREAFLCLEAWANDNVPFPAAAYVRYIRDLYQQNQLVRGVHYVRERRVDLSNIRCPTMAIVASRDAICPPKAATALLDHVSTDDTKVLEVPGGHVGAVVGSRAQQTLYPGVSQWMREKLCN